MNENRVKTGRRIRLAALLALVGQLIVGGVGDAGAALAQDPGSLRIPIRVQETAGVARRADPVTVGVPLPVAAGLRNAAAFAVQDESGRVVPAQFDVLSRWNGPPSETSLPIRWLEVSFQADVPAHGRAEFALVAAAQTGGGEPLARQTGAGVAVDTGPLAFQVAGDRFRVVEDVRIDLTGSGVADFAVVGPGHDGGIFIKRVDGSLYTPEGDTDIRVTLERNGPLTAVIRIDGRHVSATANQVSMDEGRPPHEWLGFTARIHAYRGKPWVRVSYTVRNSDRFYTGRHNQGGEPVFHEFESLSLILPLRTLGDPLTLTLGGEAVAPWAPPGATPPGSAAPAWTVGLAADTTGVLYQDSSGAEGWNDGDRGTTFRGYVASVDETGLGRGNHAAGWGDVSALAWGLTVGVDGFWQQFPKGLRFGGQGQVAVDLWPEQARRPHRLEGGRQKTHDVFLDFHRQAGPDVAAFSSFVSPLRAAAPPTWYRDTLALGPVAVLPEGSTDETFKLRGFADALLDPADGIAAERLRFDAYGWRDYGDSYRAGDPEYPAFGNNELDLGWSLLMLYLMGAEQDPEFLELARPMLRHLADIDVYHTAEDADAYSHGIRQHDGSGTTAHARAPILSHAWIRGLLTWYWITGDRLALDTAREVGEWIGALVDPRSGELAWHGQSRSQAWAALALTELWEATGEAAYLDTATRLLHAEVLADQRGPESPLPCAALDWEGDAGDRERDDTSPWQNGYVAEALGRVAFDRRLAGAPDPAIENGLFRLLADLERCGYATPDNGLFVAGDEDRDAEVYGRSYRSLVIDRLYTDGSYTISYPNNHLLSDGFAYGALFTSDPEQRRRWLAMARETWMWTMGPESAPGQPRDTPTYCCPDTPAKNAAMSLRFGHVWRWVTQRMGPETRP